MYHVIDNACVLRYALRNHNMCPTLWKSSRTIEVTQNISLIWLQNAQLHQCIISATSSHQSSSSHLKNQSPTSLPATLLSSSTRDYRKEIPTSHLSPVDSNLPRHSYMELERELSREPRELRLGIRDRSRRAGEKGLKRGMQTKEILPRRK